MDCKSGINRKLKILIMSAPIGSGHRMAAAALEEALLRLENVEVVQGNVFDFFPSWLGTAFLKFYASSSSSQPRMDSSTSTCPTRLACRPLAQTVLSSSLLYTSPPPAPPMV